jgi:hypothetical protein
MGSSLPKRIKPFVKSNQTREEEIMRQPTGPERQPVTLGGARTAQSSSMSERAADASGFDARQRPPAASSPSNPRADPVPDYMRSEAEWIRMNGY